MQLMNGIGIQTEVTKQLNLVIIFCVGLIDGTSELKSNIDFIVLFRRLFFI